MIAQVVAEAAPCHLIVDAVIRVVRDWEVVEGFGRLLGLRLASCNWCSNAIDKPPDNISKVSIVMAPETTVATNYTSFARRSWGVKVASLQFAVCSLQLCSFATLCWSGKHLV
jgi:hypothetical protein